jgi:hypothetical protein
LVVSLTSGEAFDVSDIPFFKPTSEDDHGLSSMIAVIAGKVDLKSSTHIPSKAGLSEMLRLLADELLYFFCLRNDLILA